MSIGLLDPALFLNHDHERLIVELDSILRSCRTHNIHLVPLQEYWPELWRTLGRSLESSLSPKARITLRELRKLGDRDKDADVPRVEEAPGAVWRDGFEELFGSINGASWTEKMAAAALRAVAADNEVVLFTRRLKNRNLHVHRTGETTLDENTRWVLHVQSKTQGRRQILACIIPAIS